MIRQITFLMLFLLFLRPSAASAYWGPDPNLPAWGPLWALLSSALAALVSLLVWPIRVLFKKLGRWRNGKPKDGAPAKPDETRA